MPPRRPTSQPIMVLLAAIGRRWSLRVLWELRAAPLTFRALQAASGNISPSVLALRLSELSTLGIVETSEAGYRLTAAGRELGDLLLPLDTWARRRLGKPR